MAAGGTEGPKPGTSRPAAGLRARDGRVGRRVHLNRYSSRYRGQRRVWGRRALVRTMLYMATVTVTRRNPVIRVFYTRLCRRGKPWKVVLVIAMRKLLLLPTVHHRRVNCFHHWETDTMTVTGGRRTVP